MVNEVFSFSLLPSGIRKGAITEISGPLGGGKTDLVLNFLAENPQLKVAWIEEDFSVYPNAFLQKGICFERVLFVDARDKALWAAQQSLRSRIFSVVVLGLKQSLSSLDLRRFQILAKQSNCTLVLLQDQATKTGAWPIAQQITEVGHGRSQESKQRLRRIS